jgi:oxygen-independent coproporphyrinogen-3 oxidase
VTLEANPGDALDIQGYRAAGVTRLSLGVQSLDDDTLARLGRRHLARDALSAALAAVHGGFSTVSADLLFGLPGLNLASLAGAVESLGQAGIGHISLYSLEIHPATPLARDRDAGLLSAVTPEDEDRQWASLDAALSDRGFAPYEVSNYCLPGAECRHNKAYWDRKPYLGLGPGAHSYNPSGDRRSWNDPGLGPYSAALEAGLFPPGGDDPLSAADVVLESLFLGLRRPRPIDFHRLSSRVGADRRRLSSLLARASEEGLLQARPDLGPLTHAPTRKGMRAADGLAVLLAQAYARPPDSPASPPHSADQPAGETDPSPLDDAGSLESAANDEAARIGEASSS